MARMNIEVEEIVDLMNHIMNVPGDIAEIGIHKGITLLTLSRYARIMGCQTHGFDSFEGMNHPSEKDSNKYPKGRFLVSIEKVREYLKGQALDENDYKLFKGYIPSCFETVPENQMYRFAYLDVDHYEPTKIGLEWIWPRINKGGLLLLDDHFPDNPIGAPLAIQEWLVGKNLTVIPLPDIMETKTRICLKK